MTNKTRLELDYLYMTLKGDARWNRHQASFPASTTAQRERFSATAEAYETVAAELKKILEAE